MDQRIENLCLVIQRMVSLYKRVYSILERERQTLILLAYEDLFSAVKEKDEALSAIRSLDSQRLKIQDQIAIVMEKRPDDVSLKFIGEAIASQNEPLSKRVLGLREELRSVLQDVADKVEQNKVLTEKCVCNLQDVASNISSLLSGRAETNNKNNKTYSGNARIKKNQRSSGSIVEERY